MSERRVTNCETSKILNRFASPVKHSRVSNGTTKVAASTVDTEESWTKRFNQNWRQLAVLPFLAQLLSFFFFEKTCNSQFVQFSDEGPLWLVDLNKT
jgi:hypothetical protein